jgi:hypothetical protein
MWLTAGTGKEDFCEYDTENSGFIKVELLDAFQGLCSMKPISILFEIGVVNFPLETLVPKYNLLVQVT